MLRRVKIVATLGPSSASFERIDELVQAGVNVFRLNFSHTTQHEKNIHIIRSLEEKYQRPITILADLQGPKWRIGQVAEGGINLTHGQTLTLDQNPQIGDASRVPFLHHDLYEALNVDDIIRLDDGRIQLTVTHKHSDAIETRVDQGGVLSSHKGVNIPYVDIPTTALTPKDLEDLEKALGWGVDWLALSFVQRASDVIELKEHMERLAPNSPHPLIMAKLEKPNAVKQLDHILEESNGIMVARGDLGVELPLEEVPTIQRQIITACRKAGKPVVVATQMLESMIQSATPTRAEVSDVATAVYEGADAVMLSGESAVGKYPVEAVSMMARIIQSVEKDPVYRSMLTQSTTPPLENRCDAITTAARHVASTINVAALCIFTLTGATPLRAARERPESPIVSITPSLIVARQLGIVWGVEAIWAKRNQDLSDMTEFVCSLAIDKNLAQDGEYIAILSGMPLWKTGGTNILRVEAAKRSLLIDLAAYLETYG